MSRSQILTSCLLLCGILFLGCTDNDEDADPTGTQAGHPSAEMVDSWLLQSVTVNGVAGDLATVLEWHAGVVAAKFHIYANSAYVFEEVDNNGGQIWAESGFIYVGGNEIDINIQQDSEGPVQETSTVTFTLVGDTMTFTEVEGGNTNVITMIRQP